MRLLHILSQRPGKSGSGVFFKAMLREAARKGYRQHAVVGGPPQTTHRETPPLHADEFSLIEFPGVQAPFDVPGMSDVMPYPSTVFSTMDRRQVEQYLAACRTVLERVGSTFRPQLVHAHHLWLITSLAQQVFPNIPLVATAHNSELRQLVKAPHLASKVVPGIQKVGRICVLTPQSKEDTVVAFQADPDRIAVTGAGFRQEHFQPPDRPQSEIRRELRESFGIQLPDPQFPLVTFVGRLSTAKGIPFLLEAARRIHQCGNRPFRLLLVGAQGSGGDGERMLGLARQARPFAVSLGAVSQRAVALILQCSQLFVLPSLYEGLPLVMLEAAACGCPILISGLPAVRSWVSRGWLQSGTFSFITALQTTQADWPVESDVPRFVEELADSIGRQLENPASPAARRALARLAAPHCWASVFSGYERAYLQAGEAIR